MAVDSWDEIRTAYQVARAGTVSGAAEALGVHHATVIRHVGSLEASLGVKLFQRHARGYTPTEAGQDLLTVARATDDQFEQLVSRVKGRGAGIGGELVVTSLNTVSPFLVPVIHAFQREHPGLTVRYLTGDEVLRLEYGEAHVAVRAGARPGQLDNVVQKFLAMPVALYGSRAYLERAGTPGGEDDLARHDFVALDDAKSRAPFQRWLVENVPAERIVFRVSDQRVIRQAILEGVGLGFSTPWEAARHPEMVEVMPPREEWSAPLWLVTHVDLHRTAKVQGFLAALKAAARDGMVGTAA